MSLSRCKYTSSYDSLMPMLKTHKHFYLCFKLNLQRERLWCHLT